MKSLIQGRNGKTWLMTLALVVVPGGGVLVLLYGAARLLGRKRCLTVVVLLLTLLSVQEASRTTGGREALDAAVSLDSHIEAAASRYGIPANLIAAIIDAESNFDSRTVSPRGARGLMQLMPATVARVGVADPFDPGQNIEGGVRHLRGLMDQFSGDLPLVLAAYNAGAVAVLTHRGIPPYRETREYVTRILRRLDRDDMVVGVTATW